jgi:ABC-type glutathione transport system ATPase component
LGDSGSGKTTLGKILCGLEPPTRGLVSYRKKPLPALRGEGFRRFRREVQMLFQDPEGSLNPRRTIRASLADVISLIRTPRAEREQQMRSSLQEVGLSDLLLERFPSQLSGGENQRLALARILLLSPRVIVLDEPTSALDPSVRAHILQLLRSIQKKRDIAYVLITHDRDVAEFMCHRIFTLDQGRLVPPPA